MSGGSRLDRMETTYPSIFNDVIGPVMRGPSSSHCAAAVRIGRLARDLMDGRIERVLLEFDSRGSLAFTHASQGSDMGFFGGLLGLDAQDERLRHSDEAVREAGIRVEIRTADFGDPHPNTYRITLESAGETHRMIALSTGGGMLTVTAIDDIPLRVHGDYYETLVWLAANGTDTLSRLRTTVAAEDIFLWEGNESSLIEIKTRTPLSAPVLSGLGRHEGVVWVRTLSPVLPILSRRGMAVPFISSAEMLDYNQTAALDLGELAARYESARGGISEREVFERMFELVRILRKSITEGIGGTRYADRILSCQAGAFQSEMDRGVLLDAGMLNTMILYATALMEVKSAMGVIVAAPTAGSCGALPGAVIAAVDQMGLPETKTANAMLAAGMIGVFIAAQATFAAEVCGCQAECGAGSAMAAAALTTLAGGSTRQAVDAASMAMQNTLGLICDPVANRVEVPCLGRNVLAVSNALACANMALAGFDVVIPIDEVIETMNRVGQRLPVELRCTALGGLSITASSKMIEKRLASCAPLRQ